MYNDLGGSMTNNAKQKIVRTNTEASFPFLIELHYKDKNGVAVTERYVNADEQKTYNGNVYLPACFSVIPPSMDNSSVTDGKLTFSVIDNNFINKIRDTQERMTCVFVAVIDYEDDGEQVIEEIETMSFILVKANWNETECGFNMLYDDRMNYNVPMDMASVLKVPALG